MITLNGTAAVNQEAGVTYTDLGASASDLVDGSVSVTVDANAVNVNVLGSYTVTYSATDAANNTSQYNPHGTSPGHDRPCNWFVGW